MPELGKYAVEVASAYAASAVLIAGLVWWSIRRSRAARVRLEALEAQLKERG